MDLARTYAAFRGSPIFLLILTAYVAGWIGVHYVTGFDPEFGILNMSLSIEASVSLAFFTMIGERQARMQSKQTASLTSIVTDVRNMSVSMIEVAKAQKAVLETHTQVLETLRKNDAAILELAAEAKDDDAGA